MLKNAKSTTTPSIIETKTTAFPEMMITLSFRDMEDPQEGVLAKIANRTYRLVKIISLQSLILMIKSER